jgi:hypothetical protein
LVVPLSALKFCTQEDGVLSPPNLHANENFPRSPFCYRDPIAFPLLCNSKQKVCLECFNPPGTSISQASIKSQEFQRMNPYKLMPVVFDNLKAKEKF